MQTNEQPPTPDVAARRLQRMRAHGLSLSADIDDASPSAALPRSGVHVAQLVDSARQALIAARPHVALATVYVEGALLAGEWDAARLWIGDIVGLDGAERALLAAQYQAFTGTPHPHARTHDAAPPARSELHSRFAAAAAAAHDIDERALTGFVALVHALMDPEPDAARDRITLRVELPAGWNAWNARNLRMGDAAFDVALTRASTGLEVRVEQTEGALPATLILETTVRAPITSVEIDGRSADLALRPALDHVVAPVQLVLDAARVLRILTGFSQA